MFLLGLDWPIYTWPMLSSGCWYWKYPGRRKDKPRTSRVCCKQRRPVRRLSWQTYSPASESCNGEISKRLTPPVVLYRWKNHHRCCIAKHSSAYESCNDTISEWLREGFKTPSHGKCPLGGYEDLKTNVPKCLASKYTNENIQIHKYSSGQIMR